MAIAVSKSADIQGGSTNDIVLDLVSGQPIPKTLEQISMTIGASGNVPVKVGSAATVQLSVSAEATAALIPIWSDSTSEVQTKELAAAGLSDFFSDGRNAGETLMVLDFGVKASVGGSAPIPLPTPATGKIEFKAGVDAGYIYARTFREDAPADVVVRDLFENFRTPATLNRPLREDEHLIFDFGGSATFGASVSAGWQMAGTQAVKIGKLKAAEKYAFNLVGTVGVSAAVAGRFRIDVRPLDGQPNFARVTVGKNDSRDLRISADIKGGATFTQDGFPASANEFLEAAIGTKAKSWLAYFEAAENWTDPAFVKQKLDTLAQSFVEEWTGKAVEQLDKLGLQKAFDEIKKAIASYNSLGDRVVALFDRYYDPVAKKIDDRITNALDAVTRVNDWDELKQRVLDNDIIEVLDTLSGGQIASLLNEGDATAKAELDKIKAKAQSILDGLKAGAHAELLKIVEKAKSAFGIDKLVKKLDGLDLATIKNNADKKAVGFFERIIDRALTDVKDSDIGKLAGEVNETLNNIQKFADTWYEKFRDALDQSFSFDVQAAYNKSANLATMLVFDVDLSNAAGQDIVRKAARGNFAAAFSAPAGVVNVQQGTFSRRLASQRAISINVIGWNKKPWKFDSVRDLVVESTQNLVQTPNGLVVTTDTSLASSTKRQRQNETMMSNFILSFAGQTKANGENFLGRDFMVDGLRTVGASYSLAQIDDRATGAELADYLRLASSLGFQVADPAGTIQRMLPHEGDGDHANYGAVKISYDVRFTPEGIAAALRANPTDRQIRFIARLMVLTNYLADFRQDAEIAWAYWGDSVFANYEQVNDLSWMQLTQPAFPVKVSPIPSQPAPAFVTLDRRQRTILDALYRAENAMIAAIRKLSAIEGPISNEKLTQELSDIGNKLNQFDARDASDSTYFAIFDHLVTMSGAQNARNATLKITATLNGNTVATGLIA